MNPKQNLLLIAAALAAGVSTLSAQPLLWSDTTFILGPDPSGWNKGQFPGILATNNGQLIVTEDFFGPMQPNNPLANHVPAFHTAPSSGPLADGQTLELRADLISASQNDAVASLAFNYVVGGLGGSGYTFNKDQDELWLTKFYDGATKFASFFYTNQPLKNANVTLVLALTRAGTNLNITTRVLDKDNSSAVLFERTITDTPKSDPTQPSGTVKGMISMTDSTGTAWPLLMGATWIQASLTWADPLLAPNPRAQVVFDNVEVWQYESPQLAIQNAVLLSWPATQGSFILESASSANGPWEAVSNAWCRTNAGCTEASICAPDSRKFFRLRFVP